MAGWRLYVASVLANLLYVCTGSVMSWPSSGLAKLTLTDSQAGWLTSSVTAGAVFSPLFYSLGVDRVGRVWTLWWCAAIMAGGWALLASCQDSMAGMVVARMVAGLGAGASFNIVPVYLAEIADAEARQAVCSWSGVFLSVGFLVVYGAGPGTSHAGLVAACAAPLLLVLCVPLVLPESPYHLVRRGKLADAATVLQKVSCSKDVPRELTLIQEEVSEAGGWGRVWRERGPRRGLLLSLSLLGVQQASAIDIITGLAAPLMANSGAPVSSSVGALLVGLVVLLAAALSPFAVRRLGARTVLLPCAHLCAACLFIFGVYMCLRENGYDLTSVNIIPVVCILSFNVFYYIGLGPVPWALVAEVFPVELKASGVAIVSTLAWLCDFTVVTSYGQLASRVGSGPIFIVYGLIVSTGYLAVQPFLPDTKGMTLHQVVSSLR